MELDELAQSWQTIRESDVCELKQQWFDLDSKSGKAQLAREVLALANSVGPDEPAMLVFGLQDEIGSDRLVGLASHETPERVAQVLATYTQPVPKVNLKTLALGGKGIDVLEVRYDPSRPHYAIREANGILRSDTVYVRRGPTVGTLTLPELEAMIRQKNARLGSIGSDEPVISGFVEIPGGALPMRVVGRIVNVSSDPVMISTQWNIEWALNPRGVARDGGLAGVRLAPGGSIEDEHDLTRVEFYINRQTVQRGSFVGDRWYNVTWTVHHRDRNGLYRSTDHYIRIAG